jgi:hypothetical protein
MHETFFFVKFRVVSWIVLSISNRKLTVCLTSSNTTQTNSLRLQLQHDVSYCCGAGEAVIVTDAVGDAAGEAAAGVSVATGDGCGVGADSTSPDCKTDRVPVTPGSERVKAISIKAAAAPIVTFANTLAVPRGPKAALDTPPEKRSPALDLPGCNKTTTTSTTQDNMNSPYKM